ncbi:MAG TPA: hypothetical protein VF816_11600 [Rhodocyclaceae bacterium]
MRSIDIISIERQARQLRAEDLRRRQPVLGPRLGLCLRLAGGTVGAMGAALEAIVRPLFSWNPQAHHGRLMKG